MAGRKKKTVTLNVDLGADLSGYGVATELTEAHRRIAANYASPLLLGPPVNDDLLELMMHLFTEDEADLVAHLPPLRPRSAQKIARLTGRSQQNVREVLEKLASVKQAIVAAGPHQKRKYAILPIVPGTFEMVLLTTDLSTRNTWHRRFAELFEKIYESGFMADYSQVKVPPVRYLPVGTITKSLNMAWPSDRLEEVLEPYDLFAVGQCQCRMSMQLVGKGCDKPLENCVSIGPLAKAVIDRGMMRKADKQEIIEIKRNAEEAGCVTWMMNEVGDWRGNVSCSCCGCCCHALRIVKDFNSPAIISRPHFMPVHDETMCNLCQKCVRNCPMEAWSVIDKKLQFNSSRCIGCGLCVVACEKNGALEMQPYEEAAKPEQSWTSLLMKMAPGYVTNSARIWLKRMMG